MRCTCVIQVMKTRVRDAKASSSLRMTVRQVNDFLDRLAGVRAQPNTAGATRSTPTKQVSQLATALASITSRVFPDELTALFTIILQGKHERNISAETFLSIMHPDALEVYKTCAPASRACPFSHCSLPVQHLLGTPGPHRPSTSPNSSCALCLLASVASPVALQTLPTKS